MPRHHHDDNDSAGDHDNGRVYNFDRSVHDDDCIRDYDLYGGCVHDDHGDRIDHDIHLYSLGNPKHMKGAPTDFARDHIKKHYGDVLHSIVVLRFDDASNALASRRVLTRQGLDGTLEVAKDGFAFWNPDDGAYETRSEPK
jgi:hypothetical protein